MGTRTLKRGVELLICGNEKIKSILICGNKTYLKQREYLSTGNELRICGNENIKSIHIRGDEKIKSREQVIYFCERDNYVGGASDRGN